MMIKHVHAAMLSSALRSLTGAVKRPTTLNFLPLQTMATSTSLDVESWFKSQIQSIYEAQSDSDLDKAFETTFSSSSEIVVNHEPMQRESFKDDLTQRRGSASSQRVIWENILTVSENDDSADEVGYC